MTHLTAEKRNWDHLLQLWREGGVMELVFRCRRHLQRWPDLPGPYLLLGDILGRLARYPEAERSFRDAEKRGSGERAIYHELLGDLFRNANRYRKSVNCYDEALRLDPHKTNHWILRARCKFDMGDLDDAELTLQGARERALGPEPEYELGRVYRAQGRLQEAADCFRRCLGLEPSHPRAQLDRDDVLNASESQPDAPAYEQQELEDYLEVSEPAHKLSRLRVCLAAYPHSYGLRLDLAGLEAKLRRYPEARQSYREAARVARPAGRDLLFLGLGSLHQKRGQWRWANHYFAKCCELKPNDAGCHIFRGAALARQGRLTEAEASHRRATLCSEGYTDEAYFNLGLVLRGQERLAEAAEALQEALARSPDYLEAGLALEDVKRAQMYQD